MLDKEAQQSRITSLHQFRNYFSFGFYADASFTAASKYNITMFPEVHIYRNPELPPLRFNEMNQLANKILQYNDPVMFHVDGFTFAHIVNNFATSDAERLHTSKQSRLSKLTHQSAGSKRIQNL